MDPNETLRLIREACEHATKGARDEDEDAELASLRELRNAFEDLDGWLTSGGSMPSAWALTNAPRVFPIEPISIHQLASMLSLDDPERKAWIFKVYTDRGWMRIEAAGHTWQQAEAAMLRRMLEAGREVRVPWHMFNADGTPV